MVAVGADRLLGRGDVAPQACVAAVVAARGDHTPLGARLTAPWG
jgi:hypothetical protein